MPAATVRIPSLLAEVGDGRREIAVTADTVGGALADLFARLPHLRVHVYEESGDVRPHVSVFYQGRAARDPAGLSQPLVEGSVITILQAVSGGCG
jgi:molybdopterin converting factor small subunit